MADTKNPGDKPLSVGTKTLSLKPRTETGVVRQSFSHGRTKQVVVEKKTKRRLAGDPAPAAEAPVSAPAAPVAPVKAAPRPEPARPASRTSGVVLRTLTEDEQSARASALADARVREEEERRAAEAEAARRNTKEFKEQQEREAAEARKKAEEERHRAEEEAKARAEREANKRTEAAAKAAASPAKAPSTPARPAAVAADGSDDDEAPRMVRRPGGGVARPVVAAKPTAKPAPAKQRGRLTLSTALNADEVRERSIASFRRRTQRLKGHASNEPKEKLIREVTIPEAITIQELANRMTERAVDVIRLLMKQGAMHKITDVIDADTAQLIAEEMGHTVKRVAASDVEEGLFDVAEDHASDTTPRPPVVTVMGHVDHGKTSLLDALRHANVVSGEAGGITQHIGAYQVTSPESGKKITFIDTPGHAAFTAMRARGAKVTDIVILVVAADDGVMPQTIEAINHAKAAGVPMIVAINKIDKPDAKPERVRTELLQHEVQVESFGGEVVDVEVSAKNKTNLDKLLEMIALQADLLDLKTNPDRPAEGTVIEAKLDRGRGPVATVLVQRGTLRVGDIIVAGAEMGRVRALINDQGETVQEAGPSVPVEVLGFNGPPEAGDRLAVVENEARARQVTDYRAHQKREKTAASSGMRGSLEQMMSQLKTTGRKDFPLVIKADVQGSLEAILGSLEKLGTDEVAARILHAGVGGISESDVTLAEGFNAAIIGFSVRANKEAAALAKRNGIEIRYYNIIYDLVDDVKKAMSGLLAPTLRETMLGNAQILEVFNISKVGKIAGCRVTDGSVERGANVRLIRDNVVVHEGKLSTLKRFKDEVKEVQSGQECGMAFENYQDMRVGDVIECYRVETIQRSL
ncbi:translation initiation factor IF-2 [Bradyrhizobium sp. G127]|uniref:translation initiation factor IF-2 n=1 Tax=Bradyrhizobium sp. G127 TaxID=2904800 RepID=UPI001F00DDDC|nr:translation initiation factor IF-2 [Bradyrhizobium sp. G127]MCF2521479.1 translation initiation factor IF-2 [Bradyrhizobium sp. G127]